MNGEKAADKEAVINIDFTDTNDKVVLILNNGVLNHRLNRQEKEADLTLSIAKMDFVKLFFGRTDTEALRNAGKIKMQGDEKAIEMLRCCFEAADSNFKIVLP